MSSLQLCYTVYDSKAETFMPPFFVPSKGLAIRAFEDCVNSDDHHFGKHPADYTLFSLGAFNTDVGHFDFTEKQSVGNGVEFLSFKPDITKGMTANGTNTSRSTDENG